MMYQCCKCGKELPKEAFYPSEFRGNRKVRCKECLKEMRRKQHFDKVKNLFGVSRNDKGQLVEYNNHKKSIYWTGNMLSTLKRYYPCTSNAELAELLNVSERTILRKSRELGLSKSEEYITRINTEKSLLGTIKRYYDKSEEKRKI